MGDAPVAYEDTDHYQVYKAFMEDPARYLEDR